MVKKEKLWMDIFTAISKWQGKTNRNFWLEHKRIHAGDKVYTTEEEVCEAVEKRQLCNKCLTSNVVSGSDGTYCRDCGWLRTWGDKHE